MEYTPAYKRLARNLDFYMKLRQISKRRLSIESGVNYGVIDAYLKAKRFSPDLMIIRQLARVLEVNVGELLKEEENV